MSHILCPLCGKNTPMSRFDPEALDLDLRACSFKGAGRGPGFKKIDEHSVLNDETYSKPVARRVLTLTKMFLDHKILDIREVIEKIDLGTLLGTISARVYEENTALIIQNNDLKNKYENIRKHLSENRIKMMQKLNEEEINEMIDYVLRGGLDLDNKRIIEMDHDGWWINVDGGTPGYILYLQYIYPLLTGELRTKIRERVKTDDENTLVNLKVIWAIKRIPSIAEKLSGEDKVEQKVIDGQRYEIHSMPYTIHTSLNEIKSIVATVKKKIYEDLKKLE